MCASKIRRGCKSGGGKLRLQFASSTRGRRNVLSRAPQVCETACDFRRFVTGINTGQRPGSRTPGALRPAPPALLLRSWGRAGGGPRDQVPDQPWCSAAAAPAPPQEDLGGIFHCPVPWSFHLPRLVTGRRAGEVGGGVPRKEIPPPQHPTGIRGGGGRASPEYWILFVFSGPGMPRCVEVACGWEPGILFGG